jgi:hypothetical protein
MSREEHLRLAVISSTYHIRDDVKEGCDPEALATEFINEIPDKKFSSAAV